MRRRGGLSLLGALLLCLALGTEAKAAYDPIASGQARLTLAKSFQALLKENAIKLSVRSPATLIGQRAAIFPTTDGILDPTTGKGVAYLEGELLFERKSKRVPLKHLMVKAKHEPLYAKVGGGQQKLGPATELTFTRKGFDSELSATGLKLSAKTATRLDKRLHTDAFQEGQLLGTLTTETKPRTTAILPLGRTTLTPDPAFMAKLDSLFVSLNPIAPAERSPGPIFSLPIIPAGALSPDGSQGTLRTGGSLEFLQLGAGQVFWHELWFELGSDQVLAEADIEPSPSYPGKLGQVPILDLWSGSASSDPRRRTISVSAAALALQPQTAAFLNQAFAESQQDFRTGEVLGTLSFSAQGQ